MRLHYQREWIRRRIDIRTGAPAVLTAVMQVALLVALSLPLIGCRGYRTPFNTAPGTTQQQRFEAVAHDPYPQEDLGPEVTGGRPRDYQKPIAEPIRDKMYREKRFWFGN